MPLRESARPARPARPASRPAPDEEDERPLRGRTSRRSADDAPASRRGRSMPDNDADDADEPRRGRGRSEPEGSRPRAASGWDGLDDTLANSSSGGTFFKVDYKKDYIIAFLDEGPFASYSQHWIGKKSYNCLYTRDDPRCPLCDDVGSKRKARACFDVIAYDMDTGEPKLVIWEVSISVIKQLREYTDKDIKLTDGYWQISKTKTGSGDQGSTTYNISRVKERDLDDDWKLEAITDKEFEEFGEEAHEADFIKYPSRGELRAVADEILRGA